MIKLIYPQLNTLVMETNDQHDCLLDYTDPEKLDSYDSNEIEMTFYTSLYWNYVFVMDALQEFVV